MDKSIVFRPSRHQFKDTLLRGKGRESKSGLLDKPVRKQVSSFYANVSDLTKSVSVKDTSECGCFFGGRKSCYPAKLLQRIRQTSFNA